jgi:extracellular factor (EF) 3-hydroxypalmitic acid methyl ester biosynthesis protein
MKTDFEFLDALNEKITNSPELSSTHVAEASEFFARLRAGNDALSWAAMVKDQIAPHPAIASIRQCPLTARCAYKPRGYAGDAVMIDYIYGTGDVAMLPDGAAAKSLFAYTTSSPPSRAVRYRRHRLADLIDSSATEQIHRSQRGLRILSVAAGHGRELELSAAFRSGLISEFVALDQDAASLDELKRAYANSATKITTLEMGVKSLLGGKHGLGSFDLIYSAGLYDYLDTPLATRLTAKLFSLLNPHGRLMYANFATEIFGIGYMEAAMDWWLIYRDAKQTKALSDEIDMAQVKSMNEYTDPGRNIYFVELERAAA